MRVTGTPSIGKSCFLWYVYTSLVRKKKKVYATVDTNTFYSEAEDTIPPSIPNNCDVIHLCDPSRSAVIPKHSGVTIFLYHHLEAGVDIITELSL